MNFSFSAAELEALADLVASKLADKLAQKPAVELLTESQVAELCHVAPHTVRDARKRKELRCTRIGRYPRYARMDVEKWLTERK
jgi:hypothetical protein